MDLSFTISCHTSEQTMAMTKLIPSLPSGVEIILLLNENGEDGAVKLVNEAKTKDGGVLKIYSTQWKEFDFSTIRNQCLALATRGWIMWLDADELLATSQFGVFENLVNVPRGVGALMVTVAGLQPSMFAGDEPKRFASAQPRLIRNDPSFRFRGLCHEQIMWSIQENGYQVQETTLVVIHTGYVQERQSMIGKMERNVSLLIRQCNDEPDTDDMFYHKLLFRDLQNLLSLKEN